MTGLEVSTKEGIIRRPEVTCRSIALKGFSGHFDNNILITFAIGYFSAI